MQRWSWRLLRARAYPIDVDREYRCLVTRGRCDEDDGRVPVMNPRKNTDVSYEKPRIFRKRCVEPLYGPRPNMKSFGWSRRQRLMGTHQRGAENDVIKGCTFTVGGFERANKS